MRGARGVTALTDLSSRDTSEGIRAQVRSAKGLRAGGIAWWFSRKPALLDPAKQRRAVHTDDPQNLRSAHSLVERQDPWAVRFAGHRSSRPRLRWRRLQEKG